MPVHPTPPPSPYRLFVGVDIAAASFTTVWVEAGAGAAPSRPFTLEQSPQGFATLHARLHATGHAPADTLIVMEATSSYWVALATTLAQHGYAVAVINPHQAHSFAKALLQRAKTDARDARMLAHLAATLQPTPWTPPPAIYAELQQRLAERDALIALRQQVRNQRHALAQLPVVVAAVRERMEDLLAMFEAQIAAIEREIAQVLQQDAEWAASAALLVSITGIGLLTAAWLLVATLNFTTCPDGEAAAGYAGLTPQARRSGTSVRGRARLGHSGHKRLRTALYMATLSATRRNPRIKAFYDRLRAAGKPPKVARCAAARKLLQVAWAVVRDQRAFDPAYQPAQPAA
jgi:transposase